MVMFCMKLSKNDIFIQNMLKTIHKIENALPGDCFTNAELQLVLPGTEHARQALIKRALKGGGLVALRRGFYCLGEKFRGHPLELFVIAQKIYALSAISLESALSFHGLIPEAVPAVTSVAIKRTKEFLTPFASFVYHHVPEKKFLTQIHLHKLDPLNNIFMASPLRAICDMIHVYKKDWKGIHPLKQSLRIEEENLLLFKADEIEELRSYYHSHRLDRFLKALKKDLHL